MSVQDTGGMRYPGIGCREKNALSVTQNISHPDLYANVVQPSLMYTNYLNEAR